MPTIIKRTQATIDLAEIWDYIADDSEDRADGFIDSIDSIDRKFRILANQPNIGRVRDELVEGLRSFPIGRYIIFYRPLPDGIEVIRRVTRLAERVGGAGR